MVLKSGTITIKSNPITNMNAPYFLGSLFSLSAIRFPLKAARKEAISKGTEAVKESGEAKSMNAQVATQGLVIAAMGFSPSFDAYSNVVMRDVSFYKPFTIYGGQKNVDNARAGRRLFGATDQLHNEMTSQQYQLGK